MKKAFCLLAAALLFLLYSSALTPGKAETILLPEEIMRNKWYLDEHARVKAGNPTPLQGRFFTSMWGGTTSDLDVQDLLHAYSPILWDGELGRFRFDHSVVQDAAVMNDESENRVYLLVFYDDLYYSDGTKITARDYAFSILLQMDPAVAETGGKNADFSWLAGSDARLNGETDILSGVRIIADNILQITMKAESLPYYYELNRLNIRPCPAAEIAPGTEVRDDGEGVYLSKPITADTIREMVLDERVGYLSHPRVVSGPYVLETFDGTTAKFAINPYYKGNEKGMTPRIGEIEYTLAKSEDMITRLRYGEFDLLSKVTPADTIRAGIKNMQADMGAYAMDKEARTGLTLVWFTEDGATAQEPEVRRAIARCFDRDAFVRDYTGQYGLRVDGFYGLGQWTYRTAAGLADPPAALSGDAAGLDETEQNAWEAVSLDGLTTYEPDTGEAVKLLEAAGWTLNEAGEPFDPEKDRMRYKKSGEELTGLQLTMAIPVSENARRALNDHLTVPLRKAGISLTLVPVSMETLREAYGGKTGGLYDMLYLGDNFTIIYDPEIFAPQTDGTELGAARKEICELARDMVRTEPEDLYGFAVKWVKLQEKITERLPLLPVYSNEYFDFFTRRLHDYRVTESETFGRAIVSAYMSDIEEMDAEEKERIEKQMEEALGE